MSTKSEDLSNGSRKGSSSQTASPSVLRDMIAGAFAGFVGRLVTAPFDVIKIRFQLQSPDRAKYKSLGQAFRLVVKEEGFTSLWKGNLAATYLWVSYVMIQFGAYGVLKRFGETLVAEADIVNDKSEIGECKRKPMMVNNRWMQAVALFVAGAGAGIGATVATYPFDIMRTQFAIQGNVKTYDSMKSFVTATWHTRGLSGFYAGMVPAVIGIAPAMGLNFALYETFKAAVDGPLKSLQAGALGNFLGSGLCGALAGGTSKFIVYPLDTIKKRLQNQVLVNTLISDAVATATPSSRKYKSFLHCAQTIVREEGIKGLYRGIVPTVTKSFVATAATFAAYEAAVKALNKTTATN